MSDLSCKLTHMRSRVPATWLLIALLFVSLVMGCNFNNNAPHVGDPGPEMRGAVVSSIAFSPDGHLLAIGYENLRLILIDPKTGSLVRVLKAKLPKEIRRITTVAFSPDGKTVACSYIGNFQDMINCWDVASGKLKQTISEASITVAFSPDGKLMASGGAGAKGKKSVPTILLRDTRTKKLKKTLQQSMPGAVRTIAFSPDSKVLTAASGTSEDVYIEDFPTNNIIVSSWNIQTGKLLWSVKERTYRFIIAYSPNGKFIANESGSPTLKFRDAGTGKLLRKYQPVLPNALAFSPDSRSLAVGTDDGRIAVRDTRSGGIVKTLSVRDHNAPITCIAYLPNGKSLACGSEDHTVIIWNTRTWRIQRTIGKRYVAQKNPFS